MADLPRPKIEVVTTSDDKKHLVISRDTPTGTPRAKTFEIRGDTENDRLKNLGGDILGDRKSGEWLP